VRADALAAAGISCLDAATDAWTASGGTVSHRPDLVDRAMGVLHKRATTLSDDPPHDRALAGAGPAGDARMKSGRRIRTPA